MHYLHLTDSIPSVYVPTKRVSKILQVCITISVTEVILGVIGSASEVVISFGVDDVGN